ncbi:MAG: hypothetical protein Q4D13_06405, partial [Erysipelotrichaceae bacterium]|nr:hypothetical protein [Erysipelotrichaceae bacterium]
MKKFINSLMVMLLMISPITANVIFADEEDASAETVTTQDVIDSLEDAKDQEIITAIVDIPEGVTDLDPTIIVDELVSAANEKLAEGKVDDAQNTVDSAEESISDLADEVFTAKDEAIAAAEEAVAAKDDAESLLQTAVDAANEAANNLNNESVAEQAAQTAEAAAIEADLKAQAAEEAATAAEAAAEEANAKYLEALDVYNQAVADINEQLEAGLINAEKAEELTADAADKAEAYRIAKDEQLANATAARVAAEAATAKAVAAREAAQAKTAEAKDALAEANANLVEQEAILAGIAAEGLVESGKDAIAVAATGAALIAAKAAVAVADAVVDYNEGELAKMEEQQKELETSIEELNAEIAKAEEELTALKADETASKEAVDAAQDALDSARAALAEAEAVRDNQADIIADMKAAEEAGIKAQMEADQATIKSADATEADKTDAIKNLTETVLSNELGADVAVSDDASKATVTTKDEAGNSVSKDYAIVVDDNGVVQYHEITVYPTTEVTNAEQIKGVTDWSGLNEHFKVVDENGKTLYVTGIINGTITVNAIYDIKFDENGAYYEGMFGVRHNVTVTDLETPHTEVAEEAIGTNSNTITDRWEIAQNAEKAVADANQLVSEKDAALTSANNDLAAASAAVANANDAKAALENNKDLTQDQIDALQADIDALDTKINGSAADQIIRSIITGEEPSWSDINPGDIKTIFEDAANIKAVIDGIGNGNVVDSATAIAALISSDAISLKTKAAIVDLIEDLAQNAYDNALSNLEDTVAEYEKLAAAQLEEVKKAQEAVNSASANLADAQLKETAAILNETEAKLAEANANAKEVAAKVADAYAKTLEKEALEAERLAKEAADKLRELILSGLTPDDTDLVAARKAAEEADAAAKTARDAADAERAAADEAALIAIDARN